MIGYARAVSSQQLLERQRVALQRAGCTIVHSDDRPGGSVFLTGLEAALEALQAGDALCVVTLDRITRSPRDLWALAAVLSDRQQHLVSLADDLDTRRDNGAFFGFCAVMARLHAAGDHDRRQTGANPPSARPGPALAISDHAWSEIKPLIDAGELTVSQAATRLGVHRATVYRRVPRP